MSITVEGSKSTKSNKWWLNAQASTRIQGNGRIHTEFFDFCKMLKPNWLKWEVWAFLSWLTRSWPGLLWSHILWDSPQMDSTPEVHPLFPNHRPCSSPLNLLTRLAQLSYHCPRRNNKCICLLMWPPSLWPTLDVMVVHHCNYPDNETQGDTEEYFPV